MSSAALRFVTLLIGIGFAVGATAQDGGATPKAETEAPPARLGILLDISPEMGFLVPQVRKEVRLVNEQLQLQKLPEIPLREFRGASLDRDGSLSVPGRKNALYALRELYQDDGADTVLWISSLRGSQSGDGFFAVEQLLSEVLADRPARRLILRNAWQEQLVAGDRWVRLRPAQGIDPLAPGEYPEDWYRMLGEDRGLVFRSWQVPPQNFRKQFAFPHRINNSIYLRELGIQGAEGFFETRWAQELAADHGLHFIRPEEVWLQNITGRRWLYEASLTPFISEASLELRCDAVYRDLCDRESIEEDLARIPGKKVGALFAFGYVDNDLARFETMRDANSRNLMRFWRNAYLADVDRIASEIRDHRAARQEEPGAESGERVYASEFIELETRHKPPDGPDPVAARMARLVREEGVDAIYLFTNGFIGGGEYGTPTLDLPLVAHAIRDAGVKLYVRQPFEFGPTPIALQQLALASGGGVFLGRAGDDDWDAPIPPPAWPERITEKRE